MHTMKTSNGDITYYVQGEGETVVLVMGAGSPGRVWWPYQVPALVDRGYRVVTMDNRGVGGSGGGTAAATISGFVDDLESVLAEVADRPVHLIGTSLGARISLGLTLRRPDLVSSLVLLAAHAQPDVVIETYSQAQVELAKSGIELPSNVRAAFGALANLSPATLNNPLGADDWLATFQMGPAQLSAGVASQFAAVTTEYPADLSVYSAVTVRTMVIAFADDRITPPRMGKAVAKAIHGCRFVIVPDAGHVGYLEQPTAVNDHLVDFLEK
ncbi:alpha/beta hydrolase [Rhodococcus sp. C3V]|uniref:alpha/beta fold hydrolase n=1 Tax=Rhodococcus sp. C3V TaxID=3034165 RepID=UPI0023E287F7|nr:alpha/beta hydrolase [Rhodococcus sp. C3V]